MANPGDLVTLPQAEAWLQQTADPGNLIAGLVSAVSTQIQNFVGYQFASASYTRTFNGNGGQKMLLPDRPVTAVASLTIDGIAVPAGAVGATPGYLFDNKFLYLYGGGVGGSMGRNWRGSYVFTRDVQNVTVTYTAGYATVPYDVQQACLNWLGSAYALLGEDPTVKQLRAGDTQIDFSFITTKLGEVTLLIPPAIAAAISPYQRVAA
jgi:hypothetical protein